MTVGISFGNTKENFIYSIFVSTPQLETITMSSQVMTMHGDNIYTLALYNAVSAAPMA
jgi:hypothetical protein